MLTVLPDLGPPAPTTDLEPCPFCGSLMDDYPMYTHFFHPGAAGDGDCILSGKGFRNTERSAWNRREALTPPSRIAHQ
jgi:hypothetical protein